MNIDNLVQFSNMELNNISIGKKYQEGQSDLETKGDAVIGRNLSVIGSTNLVR